MNGRDDRGGFDRGSYHKAKVEAADLVGVFVQPIDGRLRLRQHTGLPDWLDDAHNRVPVTLLTRISKFEPPAQRRLPLKVPSGKHLVDDGQGQLRGLIGRSKKSASA